MTTSDKGALAQRAVVAWQKCGLAWAPGMLDDTGHRVTDPAGQRPSDRPDLDDHATLGCIEHGLLQAAWADFDDPVRVDVVAAEDLDDNDRPVPATMVRVLYWSLRGWRVFKTFTHRDKAEALVLCLEAAAERREP